MLEQIYSELYSSAKVYCSSADIENAKIRLAQLLLLAEQDVAISDFNVDAQGKVSAVVYAPADTQVTLNGEKITFNGNKAVISGSYNNFVIAAGDAKIDLLNGTAQANALSDETLYTVLNGQYQENENASITKEDYEGTSVAKIVLGSTDQRIYMNVSSFGIDKDTKTLVIGVYAELGGGAKKKADILLAGSNLQASLDTVYLHEGYNEIRLNRIGDVPWSKLKSASNLVFNFAEAGGATVRFVSLATVK